MAISNTATVPSPIDELDDALQNAKCALAEGRHNDAVMACERAIRRDPPCPPGLMLLGLISFETDQPTHALTLLNRAQDLDPSVREYTEALAAIHARLGNITEALFQAKMATTLTTDDSVRELMPENYYNFFKSIEVADPIKYRRRAQLKFRHGRLHEALFDCHKQLEVSPNDIETFRLIADAAGPIGKITESLEAAKSVIGIGPATADDLIQLSHGLSSAGEYQQADDCLQWAAELTDDKLEIESHRLANLTRDPATGNATLGQAHRRWSRRCAAPRDARPAKHDLDPDRPLRVALLSGQFRNTDLAALIDPVLRSLDQQEFPHLLYADGPVADHVTDRLQLSTDRWTNLHGIDHRTAAEILRGDKIDIAIDLNGHGAHSRLLTLAQRPAPVSAAWLAYPISPGAVVDYMLAPDNPYKRSTEAGRKAQRLATIGRLPVPFHPPNVTPDVSALPALSAGHLTFGIQTDVATLGSRAVVLWSRLLLAVPGARLLIANNRNDQPPQPLHWVAGLFTNLGVGDRVDIVPTAESLATPYDFYAHVDVALDSTPYGNAAETYRALWMGCPVLTIDSDWLGGYWTAAILVSRFRSSHDFRLLFSDFDCSEAEALDGAEDVIGGFGPFEGFGVLVCRVDVVEDGALQLLGGAMDAAPDLLVGQQPEPALDLVQPGGAGGCEMGLPARPFGEPVADRLGLVGPVVVHDDVDVEISRDVRLDEVEEFAELSGPMARETFADDLSRGDVEGREERGRAVALVVVAAPLRLPGAHRQEGLGTVQGLDLALFVDTENQGTIRRRQIQTDDVADLLHEEGIARQLEGLRAMRLQAEGPPDAMNGRGRVAARPRHRAKAPMGRVRRRLFQRQPDRFRDGVIADLTRRAGAGFVVQTVEALRRIAATPLAHGVRARLETNGDLLVLQPFRRRQDDPSPPRKPLRRLATTRQRLQFGALVIAQRDRHRHSRHQSRLLKTNRDIIISIYRSGH